jgi:pSer/pThr/pTyr-binding forkhead associated (FHA) protein
LFPTHPEKVIHKGKNKKTTQEAVMLKITLKFGDKVLQTIKSEKRELTIGRNPGSDIQIDNLGVSDQHARIIEEKGRYVIEDLDSTNGTFVDEKRITRAALDVNSEVIIGKHSLVVHEASTQKTGQGPKTEKTMKLDTREYKEMLKKQ